jgi:glycosyltransferase involved in cell wall biosynthesis
MASRRKPGISVLVATQNEEAVVSLCVCSFLEFGDELIIVDNGSSDHTKEIVQDLAAQHPRKIKFFDAPLLPDLYHNRQYAYERSSYQWIVRADGDFVAYTDGHYDIRRCREYLLARPRRYWPAAISVPLCNVSGDFWHTGMPPRPGGLNPSGQRAYIPPAMTGHRLRVYRYVPGFRFVRRGRWEGVRYQRLYELCAVRWDRPLWMHVNLKSDRSHLFRSERTNWREFGDFERFPTLGSYIESVVEQKYGTRELDEAARRYMSQQVLPYLVPYDPVKNPPYPRLAREQMERNPIYRIVETDGQRRRKFLGLDSTAGPPG